MSPLTITIDGNDLPAPGEDYMVEMGGYTILIANDGAEPVGVTEADVVDAVPVFYSAVDAFGGTKLHAAEVRRHPKRTVVSRWTLCSQTNSRRVQKRRRDLDLTAVNCTQCRARLVALGEL